MEPITPEQIDSVKVSLGTSMSNLLDAIDKGHWANAMLIGNLIQQQLRIMEMTAEKMIYIERLHQENSEKKDG